MIRKLNEADIDKVMDIWMKSTIKAHDFISKEYWQNNYNTVKHSNLPYYYIYNLQPHILSLT